MAWLIAAEMPLYPTTEPSSVVGVTRHPLTSWSYDEAHELLARCYPTHTIYTPLQFCPGGTIVMVYISPNRDGIGRQVCPFQLWAVKKEKS